LANLLQALTDANTCLYLSRGIYYRYYGTAYSLKGSHNSMATTQHPVSSANSPRNLSYRMVFSRLFRSIFIGIAITLLLTAIELAMIWFFNPINILGDKRADTFSILVALPMHLPLLLLIPFVELVAAALVAFLAARHSLSERIYEMFKRSRKHIAKRIHSSIPLLKRI